MSTAPATPSLSTALMRYTEKNRLLEVSAAALAGTRLGPRVRVVSHRTKRAFEFAVEGQDFDNEGGLVRTRYYSPVADLVLVVWN